MKNKHYVNLLPALIGSLGIACSVTRLGLYLLATDNKGLLIPGHPLNLFSWVLTAVAAALIFSMTWMLKGPNHYAGNFQPSAAAAIGSFAMAGGILLAVVSGWGSPVLLEQLCSIAGILCIPALITAGIQRYLGKKPFFLLYALVCLYLTLYAITHYQIWSSLPQIQDWFFSTAGIVSLILFCYYQTAFCADMGNRRLQMATGLLAGYFCLSAITGGIDAALHIGSAVWALTNLCVMVPIKNSRPAAPEQDHE